MTKIRFTLYTNYIGSEATATIELDEDEAKDWAEMDESQRDAYAQELFMDGVFSTLGGWNWEEA